MANPNVTNSGLLRQSNVTAHNAASVRERRLASATVGFVFAAWAATVLLHEVNIGGRWDFVSTSTWFLIIGWIFAYTFGGALGARSGANSVLVPQKVATESIGNWMLIFCGFTIVGIALFVFDFAILRGYGFTTAAATIRLEEVQAAVGGATTSSPVSGVGRLLIPAFLPVCILFVMFRARLTKAVIFAVYGTVLLTFVEQFLFEGGRWFITTAVVAMLIAFLLLRGAVDQNGIAHKKRLPIIRLVVLGGFLLSFFAYVFVERVVQRSDYFASAYMQLASSYRLTINYDQLGMFEGPLGGLWFTICMFWLYATQGLNELDLILQQRYLDHAHGLYQVPQIGQIILLLTGVDIRYDALANLPTYGSYATFYGHSYIDFGNAGSIFFAFGLGYFTARAVRGFAAGRMSSLSMMAPALAALGVFSPIVSLIPTLWPALIWLMIAGAALAGRSARTKATSAA